MEGDTKATGKMASNRVKAYTVNFQVGSRKENGNQVN
jgi:hypothetical protein